MRKYTAETRRARGRVGGFGGCEHRTSNVEGRKRGGAVRCSMFDVDCSMFCHGGVWVVGAGDGVGSVVIRGPLFQSLQWSAGSRGPCMGHFPPVHGTSGTPAR